MNNSYGGTGDFSHAYVIMHQYFGKNQKCKKIIHKFLQIVWYIFSHDYFLHMWFTLGARNSKFNEYKKSTKWFKN
jgi:hypothetical protein